MKRPGNHIVSVLLVAILVYISIIIALLGYSMRFGQRMSKWRTNNTLQTIALNVESVLFVMNQYSSTFLSAFGGVDLDDNGFSRLVLTTDELKAFQEQDSPRLLHDFVQSNQIILGAFFCFEQGVYSDSTYQPYCHRDDTASYRMDDIYPFMQSDLFAEVKQRHHNWWHASRHLTSFNEAVLGCCTPIYLNDTAHFIGTFVMDYSLDSLGSYLRMVRPFPSSEIYVVNSLGYIICQTDSLYYGHPLTDVPDWQNSKYGNAAVAFPTLPWQVAMTTPPADVSAFMRSYLGWIALIALAGLILLSLCIYYAIRLVQRSSRQQQQMASEIHMAATIQRSFLPASLPQIPDVTVDAMLRPAMEVAGDLYEVQHEGEYLYFMVGDVSGKGLQASLMIALVGGMFRMRAREQRTPSNIMNLVNFAFSERNTEMLFCTVLIGRLHLSSGELLLCNAGHNLPVLNDRFVPLSPALPVGVEDNYPYTDYSLQLQACDRFYCYTDGVTEAENAHHQLFGDQRLLSLCQQQATLSAISQAVDDFAGGYPQSDDITLLTFTYHRLVLHSIQDIENLHPYLYPPTSESSSLPSMAELAIEEAMVNPLMHGQATWVSLLPIHPVFLITDNGVAFDPTNYNLPPSTCHLSPESGGQGIALMRQIAKEITYQRIQDTNVLTLSF